MNWKRCPNLLRFQCSAIKGATKWMVEWPSIVFGLAEIGVYAKKASKGHTYHLVCVQLTLKFGVPG